MRSELLQYHQEQTDYYNEALNSYGSKVTITNTNTEDIYYIKKKLDNLNKLGITTDNYSHKATSYKKNAIHMNSEFGSRININLLPFESPAEVKIELDNYLSGLKIETKIIGKFTSDILEVKKYNRPKNKNINDNIILSKNGKFYFKNRITPHMLEAHNHKMKDDEIPLEALLDFSTDIKLSFDLEAYDYLREYITETEFSTIELFILDLLKKHFNNLPNN